MYQEKKEIVLFGVDDEPLKAFVPEIKIRMNKGKAFDVDKVTSSKDVYEILKRIYSRNPIQENFVMLLFNRANKLIGFYKHTIGSSSATIVDIPMITGIAIKALAQGIIVSHNHPSGTKAPSEPDKEITKSLSQALKSVKINFLDHVIFTTDGYYSFADEGALNGLNNTAMITTENIISEYPGIDQSILPEALKQDEFEFIRENIDLYNDDETIKKYIDTFIEKINEVVKTKSVKTHSEPKTKKEKPKKPITNKPETESPKNDSEIQVEKLDLEVAFIKRYVGLHGKTKDKSQVLNLLNSLQKAIVEKRIRKTSVYAKEIGNIQNQLIKCYNQMGNTIQVNIDEKTLEAYTAIAHSERTMLSVMYIKQYIGLHGKQDVKAKAQLLLKKIQKAVDSEKIANSDPYIHTLYDIVTSLETYLQGKTKAPVINETTLNGLMNCFCKGKKHKETSHSLQGIEENPTPNPIPNPTVISSSDLAGMNFETIGLQGKYRELIGDPSVGFSAMVFGLPKSGKSTLCIDFANYMATHHGKTLYVSIEEGLSYTLKEKLDRLKATSPNLFIAEKLPDDLSPYQFVFIDSVSKQGITSQELDNIRKANPKVSFVYVFHTTKKGDFRGKQEYAHDVDVIIQVENGIAKANGRFGVGGKLDIFQNSEV